MTSHQISHFYPVRKWVILAAAFYLNVVVDGYCYIFGILSISIQASYPQIHPSIISLVGGITPTLYNILAPIGISLAEHLGSRVATIIASLIATSGFLLCWLNGTFFHLGFWFDFVTIGVIEGIAFSLMYGPSISTIPSYFGHENKSLAIGITTCGSAVGAIFFGFIANIMIESFGWRGTLLLFAGFSLNVAVAALSFPSYSELAQVRSRVNHQHHHNAQHAQHLSKKSLCKRFFDLSHFTNYAFLLLLGTASLSMTGYMVPLILVPGQSRQPQYHVSPSIQSNIILIWVQFLNFLFNIWKEINICF